MQINSILKLAKQHFFFYPAPASLNVFWNFGFISGVFLIIQIISGLFLAAHYTSDALLAFNSVEYIMREINYGWLLRYVHANGASFFLLAVYIHMMRGIYFRSYLGKREKVWFSGVLIFLILMATAFLGYVLPWGQMSFWGATVITNLVSALPFIGRTITFWLWGGFSVSGVTLSRFFVLHFLLPFVILGLVALHIGLVHLKGSSTSNLFCTDSVDFVTFYPYFILKDIFYFLLFLSCFSWFVFFEPNYLGHPDNYIKANPLSTPAHIVPEWYFLPFYAILRCVPDKLGGIVLMFGAIFILFFLPILTDSEVIFFKHKKFLVSEGFFYDAMFAFWVLSFIFLAWLGAKPIVRPYKNTAPFFAGFYFLFFFLFFKTPFKK